MVQIRKVVSFDEIDIEALRSLVDEFVAAHHHLCFRPDYWSPFRAWLVDQAGAKDALVLVAEESGSPVGLGTASIQTNGPLLAPERIGYIGLVVVARDQRRQGIGAALVEAMRRWFASQGIEEVELYVEAGNEEADAFWDRFGFRTLLERRRANLARQSDDR